MGGGWGLLMDHQGGEKVVIELLIIYNDVNFN